MFFSIRKVLQGFPWVAPCWTASIHPCDSLIRGLMDRGCIGVRLCCEVGVSKRWVAMRAFGTHVTTDARDLQHRRYQCSSMMAMTGFAFLAKSQARGPLVGRGGIIDGVSRLSHVCCAYHGLGEGTTLDFHVSSRMSAPAFLVLYMTLGQCPHHVFWIDPLLMN